MNFLFTEGVQNIYIITMAVSKARKSEILASLELHLKDAQSIAFTSNKALTSKGELLKKFVAAHVELTKKITADSAWAKPAVAAALQKATSKALPAALLDHAWPRLNFTISMRTTDFTDIQRDAKSTGLLPAEADLSKLFAKP